MNYSKYMQVVSICEALDISYDEYLTAPGWWIDLRLERRRSEAKADKRRNKKSS